MRHVSWRCLAVIAAMLFLSVESRAVETIEQEERAVQAWGSTNLDCREWSDGCVVCRRDTDIACSLPGIACTSGPIVCRKPTAPATKI